MSRKRRTLGAGVTPAVVLTGGWEAAFFTFGTSALLWMPFWLPAEFKVVNDDEAKEKSQSGSGGSGGSDVGVVSEWLALVKTPEVRAICAAQFAQSWGGYGLLSWLPTYFDEALGAGPVTYSHLLHI